MSAELLPPTLEQPEALGVVDRIRDVAAGVRTKLGRVAATGLLVAGGAVTAFTAEETIDPTPAHADTATSIDFE